MCIFFNSRVVESEKNLILECDAFRDIKENYGNMLAMVSCQCIFREGIVKRMGQLIINLNNKMIVSSQIVLDWMLIRQLYVTVSNQLVTEA